MSDKLPEVKEKKLINLEDFKKLAEKVIKSIREEREYLIEKEERNGNNHSSKLHFLS